MHDNKYLSCLKKKNQGTLDEEAIRRSRGAGRHTPAGFLFTEILLLKRIAALVQPLDGRVSAFKTATTLSDGVTCYWWCRVTPNSWNCEGVWGFYNVNEYREFPFFPLTGDFVIMQLTCGEFEISLWLGNHVGSPPPALPLISPVALNSVCPRPQWAHLQNKMAGSLDYL